ncbi:unnamed protein product [Urochloa humidicola]
MRPPAPKQPKPALPVPKQLKVQHPENEALSRFFLEKWRTMMQEPDGLSENNYLTIAKANRSLCAAKEPIRTLKDFSKIKGVGQWLIRLMEGFFADSSQDLPSGKGKKTRGPKSYLPGKNTAAYAILITLYRARIREGKEFMMKQELIDAAEASGLSRDAIGPNKSKAKQSYGKDWYTGWSCMKTLISKGLVIKRRRAEYLLTGEGENTARECLSRSGLDDSEGPRPLMITSTRNAPAASQVQTPNYCAEGIICCDSDSDSEEPYGKNIPQGKGPATDHGLPDAVYIPPLSSQRIFELQSASTMQGSTEFNMLDEGTAFTDEPILAMPPRQSNEKFLEAYEVLFILDDREKFGTRFRSIADIIQSQIHVPVEVRKLPVGDGIWIARHRKDCTEYVLDFIIERKEVSDLDGSIADNRYRDQKLRLKGCGLSKLIYLVEGDQSTAPESVKTACFTTEILDGFDVQRTSGVADTQKRYGHLTRSIIKYYDANFSTFAEPSHVCPTYDEFKRKCCELEKKTVNQIFALQLMQVPEVTEEASLAVTKLYPTPFLLAQAYYILDGDTRAQKEMLKSDVVNAGASRNIFKLFCGGG